MARPIAAHDARARDVEACTCTTRCQEGPEAKRSARVADGRMAEPADGPVAVAKPMELDVATSHENESVSDLYTKMKLLQRQLEFLEIQVRARSFERSSRGKAYEHAMA